MRGGRSSGRAWARAGLLAVMLAAPGAGATPAWGQVPGLPAAGKAAPAAKGDPTQQPVSAKGEKGAVFTATAGPIKVDQVVDDSAIEATLSDLLVQYPGVRTVMVKAHEGIVTLDGQVDDDDTQDQVTAFAQKVEGVRLVLNKMKTDAEALTGAEVAQSVFRHYRHVVAKKWIFAVLAVAVLAVFTALGRLFGRYSETLLAPFFGNSLLRAVVGSIISSALMITGVMLALQALNLTQAVLSILGLAGVAGLALGFAFRDIVENFIASMLLGLRRPFGIGDFITVAGKSGSVLSLDTRATTLITPEGNHIWIPNAVIYKETLVNSSVIPNTLGSVEVVIPYDASAAAALEAIDGVLCSTDCLLGEPKPRALVQALEPGGIRIRATYWMPRTGVDADKLQSDLRLRIKVALQQSGVFGTPAPAPAPPPAPPDLIAPPLPSTTSSPIAPPAPAEPPTPAADAISAANLRKDTEAATQAEAEPARPQEASPVDHAIRQAEAAAAEGGNLLVAGKSG